MAGNGGGPPGGGDGGNGQPQGTEYTLQGVMRFLQTEWHKHERARNEWDIERAEMRSRISRLEGESRTAKRLQESLGKHVKLLESALRREREKNKKLLAGEGSDVREEGTSSLREDAKSVLKGKASAPNPKVNAEDFAATSTKSEDLNESGTEETVPNEIKQDVEREKSRLFLAQCIQEVTYHSLPGTMVQQKLAEEQEQLMQNHHFQNHVQPGSMEELYAQQQRQKQTNHAAMMNSAPPNHQPPLAPRPSELPQLQRSNTEQFVGRHSGEIHMMAQTGTSNITNRDQPRPGFEFPPTSDEPVEKVSHSYDAYGQQVPTRVEETATRIAEETSPEADGWNFEDNAEMPPEATPPEYVPPSRSETDAFPSANNLSLKSSPRGPGSSRRKSSISKRRQSDGSHELRELSLSQTGTNMKSDSSFKVRFVLRGHLDVIRSVIFTGGGTPAEPEICTTGDDGVIKRWIIPANYGTFGPNTNSSGNDLDISSYFTHRGHSGAVLCLAAAPANPHILNGGRALGDGWVFSGGQDASIRVWERGRVDPKATLDGHTDAVWTVCVLPGSSSSVLGDQSIGPGSGGDRALLASGSADGTILIWAVSSPPQLTSPSTGSRRGAGGSRRANSVSSGSNFPTSPQPSTATGTPFHYSLVRRIERVDRPSPTFISPLSMAGENFVVSYNDASVLVFDTRTAEEIVGMASQETYDGSPATGVNAVAATKVGLVEGGEANRPNTEDEALVHGATGSSSGVEGTILSGHEDRYIRFFDANSGQCTYNMLAHPAAISALSLSPDGKELVSAGHDASLRFWSLEKRSCTQEINSHRLMRGEGVCTVVWSADGRWVVSGGGDGVVKVWAR